MSTRGNTAALVAAVLLSAKLQALAAETTVFVNKYFEVREHDAPVKYVWNGATRVATITGSLSTTLRIQRLRLYSGWNLVSLAVTAPNFLEQLNFLFAPGADLVPAAYLWNQSTAAYSPVSAAQTLPAGSVLWVKARTNAIVGILGKYSDPTQRQISPGGTYLSGCGLESWSLDQSFSSPASLWFYAADFRQWFARLTGDLQFISEPLPTVAPGQAIYVKVDAPVEVQVPDPTVRIRYYHQDHLGSSSVMTDAHGAVVEETAFYPFGLPRNAYHVRQIEEHYKFTQKERDRESGLNYFETRYLAATIGRFIATDLKYASTDMLSTNEFLSLLSHPQAVNLYAYVRGNPLRYIDPSGEQPSDPKTRHDPSKPTYSATLALTEGKHRLVDVELTLQSKQSGHPDILIKVNLTTVFSIIAELNDKSRLPALSSSPPVQEVTLLPPPPVPPPLEYAWARDHPDEQNRINEENPTVSTARPFERQAAESCGHCWINPPE